MHCWVCCFRLYWLWIIKKKISGIIGDLQRFIDCTRLAQSSSREHSTLGIQFGLISNRCQRQQIQSRRLYFTVPHRFSELHVLRLIRLQRQIQRWSFRQHRLYRQHKLTDNDDAQLSRWNHSHPASQAALSKIYRPKRREKNLVYLGVENKT